MKAKAPTVVFDLDGTLVDTAGDLVATLNIILAQEGCKPLALADARPLIGHGAKALLESGLRASGYTPGPIELATMTERFLAYYSAHIADHSTYKPELTPALDKLLNTGCILAVCTNKRENLAQQLLATLKLDRYFAAIVGGGRFSYSKPDPRMLLSTVDAAGGDKSQAIMVGDSMTDVATARAAGVPILLVDFGYTAIPARELKADGVISNWSELAPAVTELAK